jgi:hypothetical protein
MVKSYSFCFNVEGEVAGDSEFLNTYYSLDEDACLPIEFSR